MPKYKAIIEYDGTKYNGSQIQKEGKTIIGEIKKALKKLTNQDINITCSGRTDAGVHAKGQLIDFIINKNFANFQIREALNSLLRNEDISILKVQRAKPDFNSRFSAKKRTYEYLILNRHSNSPILKNRVWHVRKKLNIEKMREASQFLLGQHDFTSFRNTECQAKSPIKTIDLIKITKSKDIIKIKVEAPSFLHNQVRIITGTLVEVGKEKITPQNVKTILKQKLRSAAPQTAPACGLYLIKVS